MWRERRGRGERRRTRLERLVRNEDVYRRQHCLPRAVLISGEHYDGASRNLRPVAELEFTVTDDPARVAGFERLDMLVELIDVHDARVFIDLSELRERISQPLVSTQKRFTRCGAERADFAVTGALYEPRVITITHSLPPPANALQQIG
jgi:hypothetical protein